MIKPLIIYHANCADGFGAALAAWKKFGDDAEYRPMQYGQIPNGIAHRNVFVLDFSFPRDYLLVMAGMCDLTVIDHHKSAQEALADLPFCIFDMNKSGAVLAWEYFHPDEDLPELFKYIQDRDLWQWNLPLSREISAALASYEMDFDTWDLFLTDHITWNLATEGAAIRRADERYIKKAVLPDNVRMARVGEYNLIPAVNSSHLVSEVGNALVEAYPDAPFVLVYFVTDGKVVMSLRSSERGADVANVAKIYRGGGHARASGFTIPLGIREEFNV